MLPEIKILNRIEMRIKNHPAKAAIKFF